MTPTEISSIGSLLKNKPSPPSKSNPGAGSIPALPNQNQKIENKKMKTGINKNGTLQPQSTITRYNGTLADRYNCYLKNANDGKGGDITRGGKPLRTFEEWLNA
jgi:hypothetical protein